MGSVMEKETTQAKKVYFKKLFGFLDNKISNFSRDLKEKV